MSQANIKVLIMPISPCLVNKLFPLKEVILQIIARQRPASGGPKPQINTLKRHKKA